MANVGCVKAAPHMRAIINLCFRRKIAAARRAPSPMQVLGNSFA
jgi:hypothetical protein